MATPTVYVICDQKCLYESMTKEQILTAIMQAVNEGTISNIDAGFIQTIKTINGANLRFFYGDQATYNALTDEEKQNLYAIITNDTTIEGIRQAIEIIQYQVESLETRCDANANNHEKLKSDLKSGEFIPFFSDYANSAINAENLVDLSQTSATITQKGLYAVTLGIDGVEAVFGTVLLSITNLGVCPRSASVLINGNEVYCELGYDNTYTNKTINAKVESGGTGSPYIKNVYLIATYA